MVSNGLAFLLVKTYRYEHILLCSGLDTTCHSDREHLVSATPLPLRSNVRPMYRRFNPFTIGPFEIIPEGQCATTTCLPIILGTKGAFGSGEHETTAACLELLAAIPHLAGAHLLDLGSGTGILTIAALRLQAGQLTAIDIDADACRSCHDNLVLNQLNLKADVVCGELAALSGTLFDHIMANIYVDILVPLAPVLVAMTRPGGTLLLSGVPLQDKFDLKSCYERLGCHTLDSRIGEEFATYLMATPTQGHTNSIGASQEKGALPCV